MSKNSQIPSADSAVSRRSFLGSAASASLVVAGAAVVGHNAFAQMPANDPITAIFTVARTAEQLAVTFYTNGIQNAKALGLTDPQVLNLQAALIEEQIHQQLFVNSGGQSLADTFSFPMGPSTFTDLGKFIATQQQLEGVFDAAFLAAVKEFAALKRPDLAQIACQIAMIESEHRALGRDIAQLTPANNWAYAPTYLDHVSDAPAVVSKAGYLSPVAGNSYKYQPVDFNDPTIKGVLSKITNQTPSAAQAA